MSRPLVVGGASMRRSLLAREWRKSLALAEGQFVAHLADVGRHPRVCLGQAPLALSAHLPAQYHSSVVVRCDGDTLARGQSGRGGDGILHIDGTDGRLNYRGALWGDAGPLRSNAGPLRGESGLLAQCRV